MHLHEKRRTHAEGTARAAGTDEVSNETAFDRNARRGGRHPLVFFPRERKDDTGSGRTELYSGAFKAVIECGLAGRTYYSIHRCTYEPRTLFRVPNRRTSALFLRDRGLRLPLAARILRWEGNRCPYR